MAASRRTVLSVAGGAIALVAIGGYWRVMRTPQTAMAPWTLDDPAPEDIRLDAFRHAILAPNSHNLQPWRIRLVGDDGAVLFADLDRRLPQTDPFDRQITISQGTFLELARIAAAERGHALAIQPFPQGEAERLDERPIAALRFTPSAPPKDPLFAQIPHRRSNKQAYDLARPVGEADLETVVKAAGIIAAYTADPGKIEAIRALVLEAVELEMRIPRTHQESMAVMRIGAREIDANPDGLEMHGPMIEAMDAIGVISHESLSDPDSFAFRSGLKMMQDSYGSAPAFIWISTASNDRANQLSAGYDYVRLNLAATAAGLSMHPMSQSLQEYPEMARINAAMHRLLAPDGGRVQMLARIGHGPAIGPTPRRPLGSKLAV